MDLDRLARSVAAAWPRRRVLAFLAALPLLSGLPSLPDAEEAAAKERRRRRKRRHNQRKHPGKHKQKQQGCKPKGKGTVCVGRCGPVTSKETCGKTIECGSCDCDAPCAACFVCDAATRTCVADPEQVGKPCGRPGQVCARNGTCACTDSSCPACQQCGGDGTCTGCDGCCDGERCVTDCDTCQVCDDGQCTACPGCCDGSGVCQDGDTDQVCGQLGGTCAACSGPEAPDCVEHTCTCASNGNAPCPGDENCCASGCSPLVDDPANCGACGYACVVPTPTCSGTNCVGCSATNPCPTGQCCAGDGSCVTSCPGGCCQENGSCGPCLVFVTSTTSNSELGGLDGADDHCRDLATAAGLPGSYKAWLSTFNGPSPSTRFRQSTSPYLLVDGTTQVAANWSDLVVWELDHPIDMNEAGVTIEPVEYSFVWTGTLPNGSPTTTDHDCSDWMQSLETEYGKAGFSDQTSREWTDVGNLQCTADNARLYCFQQT